MVITPLKFVVKYEPPLIGIILIQGLLYKKNKKDKKKYIYNILINGLINLQDSFEITKALFQEHSEYL